MANTTKAIYKFFEDDGDITEFDYAYYIFIGNEEGLEIVQDMAYDTQGSDLHLTSTGFYEYEHLGGNYRKIMDADDFYRLSKTVAGLA